MDSSEDPRKDAVKGPYNMRGNQRLGWDILGGDGHCVVSITGILIDGSSTGKYPNGIIRTRAQQEATARYIFKVLCETHTRDKMLGETA